MVDPVNTMSEQEERARLQALHDLDILDTEAEQAFDRLTRLASSFYQSPIALISLVDEKRQWFKSRVGLDAPETERRFAFCQHAIQSDEPFIINDASEDARFCNNPLVTDAPNIRFYAGAPLIDDEGHRLGTLCIIDQKPRPEFDHAMAEQLVMLADIVISEFNLRQRNRQLAESLDEIQRGESARTEFLSVISHEIRTPLGAVVGLADTLRHSAAHQQLSESDQDIIAGMQSSSRLLMGLLDDILDMSKLDAGKITLQPSPMHLGSFVDMMRQVWAPAMQEKALDFTISRDAALPDWLQIDELRFTQVINNFIANAVKFTDRGSVSLDLSVSQKDNRAQIQVQVKDTGRGMTREERMRVFKPYEQANGGIARKYGGTGLGMAITRGLADLMGGQVSVSSIEGKGSIFSATLPLVAADAPEQKPEKVIETNHIGRKLSILVVDDVAMNLRLLGHMLDKLGHQTSLVDSGEAAIQSCAGNSWDLVIMDIRMPGIDGFEASQTILKDRPSQKIVALSADRMSGDVERAKEIGMLEYIAKPITMEGLSSMLDRHCCHGQQQAV